MNKLPQGINTFEDQAIINQLIKDPVFLDSIESTDGKLLKVYADWKRKIIVYEFLNGSVKKSPLSIAVKLLKQMRYLRD